MVKNYLLFYKLGQERKMKMNFKTILEVVDKQRNGYINTLSPQKNDWNIKLDENYNFIPKLFNQIYDVCDGTPISEENTIFFDLLPSYRLLSISEIIDFKNSYMYSIIDEYVDEYVDEYIEDYIDTNTVINNKNNMTIIPFLCDLSSSYICYFKLDDFENIVSFTAEEGIVNMYEVDSFFETVYECYSNEIYFLDEDGFLDCDYDKESEIAHKLNPKSEFWID